MSQENQNALFEKIVKKAWENDNFKKSLIADPKAAIEAEFGVKVPAGIELKVVEQTAKLRYIVMPEKAGTLSEEQLDNVAGGGCTGYFCPIYW
ncbi:MAG TPA: NHLP leader peptide family RiPP precursor [Methylomusa anaerophila]|uniref:High-molecular weight cobalt-containing nitrile hydratase subunit alpha n=1 Tax=Methylomusa anaerophila TaxID=1930071 RepID=A0A348AHU5_9FIRM|nr:NHLP leader peptide family RiPP precursor [Methylomusa anaerophila]BBB90643.1 high-molecular weight cobalt-containing nitrile hydratase subunit alpha [Methylomusa anaerophila]HML88749.1 NHLP leader peptide family RiPP precursor [Methylomusa anaerophila]